MVWVARARSSRSDLKSGRARWTRWPTAYTRTCGRDACLTDSPLSQYFAKTRQLGERTEKFDDRMDELCRDTIKNTIISLIYGDKDTDHSEAVSYELSKLEKLDAQCWIVAAAEKYLEDRQ